MSCTESAQELLIEPTSANERVRSASHVQERLSLIVSDSRCERHLALKIIVRTGVIELFKGVKTFYNGTLGSQ